MSTITERRKANAAAGKATLEAQQDEILDGQQARIEIVQQLSESGELDRAAIESLNALFDQLANETTRQDAINRILGFAISGNAVTDAEALQMVRKSTKLDPKLVKAIDRIIDGTRPDHVKLDDNGGDSRIPELEGTVTDLRAKLAAAEAKITELNNGTVKPEAVKALTKPFEVQIKENKKAAKTLKEEIKTLPTGVRHPFTGKTQTALLTRIDELFKLSNDTTPPADDTTE